MDIDWQGMVIMFFRVGHGIAIAPRARGEGTGRIIRHAVMLVMSRRMGPCFFLKGNKLLCFIRPLPSEPDGSL